MAKSNSQMSGQQNQITDEFIEVIPTSNNKNSSKLIPNNILELIQKQKPVDSDPKKLFELVSKNYENWSAAMFKQFKQDNEYSPFPDDSVSSTPIFDYSLLEALEEQEQDKQQDKQHDRQQNIHQDKQQSSTNSKKSTTTTVPSQALLNEYEMDFLRNRISQMIQDQEFGVMKDKSTTGFSLYDTRDEVGLHAGNTDECCEHHDQDDYDLEEIANDDFHTHHIEVELNTVPECDVHGIEGCDCPIYEYEYEEDEEDNEHHRNGPSCEFTFEYDHTGKLVPTYNNVEEKLRLMNLENRLKQNNLKLPSINELNIPDTTTTTTGKSKSKKKKKKKSKQQKQDSKSYHNLPSTIPQDYYGYIPSDKCCLFCEYQAIFGSKPRQMMKWYDQRILREEQRRAEFKKKLENAKSKAMKKQREMRTKQLQQQQQKEEGQQLKASQNEHQEESIVES